MAADICKECNYSKYINNEDIYCDVKRTIYLKEDKCHCKRSDFILYHYKKEL